MLTAKPHKNRFVSCQTPQIHKPYKYTNPTNPTNTQTPQIHKPYKNTNPVETQTQQKHKPYKYTNPIETQTPQKPKPHRNTNPCRHFYRLLVFASLWVLHRLCPRRWGRPCLTRVYLRVSCAFSSGQLRRGATGSGSIVSTEQYFE